MATKILQRLIGISIYPCTKQNKMNDRPVTRDLSPKPKSNNKQTSQTICTILEILQLKMVLASHNDRHGSTIVVYQIGISKFLKTKTARPWGAVSQFPLPKAAKRVSEPGTDWNWSKYPPDSTPRRQDAFSNHFSGGLYTAKCSRRCPWFRCIRWTGVKLASIRIKGFHLRAICLR